MIEVSDELSAFAGAQPTVSSIPSTGVPHAYAIYPHVGWAGNDAVAPKQTFGLTLKESGNDDCQCLGGVLGCSGGSDGAQRSGL